MKLTVDDLMRNSFVLTTKNEDYAILCRHFALAGFSRLPAAFNGVVPPEMYPGNQWIAASLSHFSIIQTARSLGLDHVTIFEYDAFPAINCCRELEKFLKNSEIPDDADMISFGNLHFVSDFDKLGDAVELSRKNTNFLRMRQNVLGAQAYYVRGSSFDAYLDKYRSITADYFPADRFAELFDNAYSTIRSFFLQVHNGELQHPGFMVDPENIKVYFPDFSI